MAQVVPEALRPAEVAKMLRVSLATLRRWDPDGSLRAVARSSGGHRRCRGDDVLTIMGRPAETAEKTAALYARVSTGKQAEAGNLERQRQRLLEYAATHGYRVVLQVTDVASGLNAKRRGLHGSGALLWSGGMILGSK